MEKQKADKAQLILRLLDEEVMIYEEGNITVNASILPDKPDTFSITWHDGEMPAYREEIFHSAEACAEKMLDIAEYEYWEEPEQE